MATPIPEIPVPAPEVPEPAPEVPEPSQEEIFHVPIATTFPCACYSIPSL